MSTYGGVPFGQFLRTDPDLLAAYRERTGMLLTDMPRLVAVWRTGADSQDRNGFSPAEAEKWLLGRPAADAGDAEDLHTFAAIWADGEEPMATDYSAEAAAFIAEAERIAALQLPVLPDDPAAAAAMRAAGYDVLAEVLKVDGPVAIIQVLSEDEEIEHPVPAIELAAALSTLVGALPGTEFIAILRETLEDGQVLSGFRNLPAAPRRSDVTA